MLIALGRLEHRGWRAALLALAMASRVEAQPSASSAPHIVLIVAEGTGFPFEDPLLSRYPALQKLRATARPFDLFFASDAGWARTNEGLLGSPRRGGSALVAALKAKRYLTAAFTPSAAPGGFDRALKTTNTTIASRVLESLDAAGERSSFVFAALDLRNVPAKAPGALPDGTPLTFPAISIYDRGPLDPVGLPVIPPPRDPADRSMLAAKRDAAFRILDREISLLMNGLDKRGLRSKTVVAIVSTGPAPRPERTAPPRPDLLFEDWLRGFALIQAPGIARPGTPSASFAEVADIAPTLAAFGGAVLSGADAMNLAPAVKEPAAVVRTTLLSHAERQAPRIGRSVRTQKYRFTQWPDGSEELFDEKADPNEWNNLATAKSMQAVRAALLRRVQSLDKPSPAAPRRTVPARRPNVLMIIADDLTAQYAQFGEVKTPNMDRLRARGRSFEKAYAPAPFCTPSRAAFLSGMSPARLQLETENAFGEVFTAKVPLIQEQFRANGYFTASVGKVWDSQPGEARGWDVNEWQPPLRPGETEAPPQIMKNMPVEAGTTTNPDEVEGDGRRAAFAVEILKQKREKPLFLALGFVRPHVSWVAPRKYFDMYPPEKVRFTKAPANDAVDIPAIAIKNRPQELPGLMLAGREPAGFSEDPAEAKRGIAAYLACVTFMDAQLGVVLDALDKNDLWKDTIVVFFGDNGHHFGDHGGLWRKNTLFEESLRVPMIVATPDLAQPGVATTALADLLDVYPTLVDLTGISRPATLDGLSLNPILQDPSASVQEALVQYRPTEPSKLGFSLRTAKYRYTLWPDGSEELYDLTLDPAGRRDLSTFPAQTATIASLRKIVESQVKP